MRTVIETAVVHGASCPDGALVTVMAIDFGARAEPLSIDEQIREALIQLEGLKERRSMQEYDKTGVIAHRERALEHWRRMVDLINGRSPRVCKRIAAERGLPHG